MEKKRSKRRKDEYPGDQQEVDKPTKHEYKVAQWMKKNLKTKKTKFLNHNVEYFTSSKAIDALLKSKFCEGNEPLFTNREQIIEYLDVMLEHKFFHRARKVPVVLEDAVKKENPDKETTIASKDKEKDEKKVKEKKREKDGKTGEVDTEKENGGDKTRDKEKKKRKIRLEMHADQVFVDGSEAYVWIYDPIPIHYWIYGFILLLGAIGICLFPLWPPSIRKGVYYLSVAAAGFLVFILVLTIVRLIVFTIAWALTAGKLHFWIFPNLTEDVGFFASFWPLYESKYVTHEKTEKRKTKSKKSKEKGSDVESESANINNETNKYVEEIANINNEEMTLRQRHKEKEVETDKEITTENDKDEPIVTDATQGSITSSEDESEISGKDYEIINPSEIQNVN